MFAQKNLTKAKKQFTQAFQQAKESVKVLSILEKETIAKARTFIRFPSSTERKKRTNQKILQSLKLLGVATRDEVEALQKKVHKLESTLQGTTPSRTKKVVRKKK